MATEKQKRAFDKSVENGGIVSSAMVEAGYSENTAHTPQKLTESRGWKELMNEYLPDSLLAEKHKELLTVPKITRHRKIGAEYEEIEESTDVQALKAGLDMAYKLKGAYAPEKKELSGEVKSIGDEKLQRMALLLEQQLKDEDGQ